MKLAQCIILDLLKDYDPVPILPETCDFHFSKIVLVCLASVILTSQAL